MRVSQLKIYRGPDQPAEPVSLPAARSASHDNSQVKAPASVLLPLIADAVASQRTWLNDFEEDEITLSADLYEVLMAYQHFRRPGA